MVLIRLRPGIGVAAGRAEMQRVVGETNKALAADPNDGGDSISVLGVLRPAEIVNYQSMGITPVILASGLALGAVMALGLTLAETVRRRRRDLALLKALGFTRRQLSAVTAWQASVAAVVGVVLGIPIGILLGRQLWILFARDIDAVPVPTVPVLSIVLIGIGAVVLANIVAAFPGRLAARTPTALALRAE
jgi:ABC-type antimicrobial peptide transport system permease subunit